MFWIASALPTLSLVAAFGDGDIRSAGYPTTALIFFGAAVHSTLLWLVTGARKADVKWLEMLVGGSVVATFGVLVDLPEAIGWHASAYALYGALTPVAWRKLVDEPSGPDSDPQP